MEMTSDVKDYGKGLIGSKVKFWWPKENKFYEGLAASYCHSGKNLVVYTSGVNEILKRESGEDVSSDQEKTHTSANSSSSMNPHMATSVEDQGEELIDCNVKVWWPKNKRYREGVIASYDPLEKNHLVVYTDGTEEMLNLRKDQDETFDQRIGSLSHSSASMICEDDLNSLWHTRKKHKGHPLKTCSISLLSKDEKEKNENHIASMDPQTFSIEGDNVLVNFGGYQVKAANVPVLQAIFSKHGDILANCPYKSTAVRASLLEVISSVVRRLQNNDVEVILSELKALEEEVLDVEAAQINVSWLRQYLAKIDELAVCNGKTRLLKEAKVNGGLVLSASKEELKLRHAELVAAQKRFKEAENRVKAMNIVHKRIHDEIQESETEEYFWRRRLDELL